jgi:DNA polymerase-1
MKTNSGGQSTNSEVLEALEDAHPVVGMIKEYGEKGTLVSSFTEKLPACIRYDGMVHSRFSLTNTPTGQVACEDPNAMAIPTQEAGRPIKQCFESRYGKKGVLISGDYSQVELRLVASASKDPKMINGFNSGLDFHTMTAALVFNVPIDEVTKEMRYIAKRINFGIIYGISANRLARKIKVSKSQAGDFLRSYFKQFFGVRAWIARVRSQAEADEQVTAWFGMVRHLPMVKSDDWFEREEALRQAVSTERRLVRAGLADRVKICNTVHDSILLDSPASLAKKAKAILYKGMALDVGREIKDKMKVELKVDINVGRVWGG